jgi:hypothetical protein
VVLTIPIAIVLLVAGLHGSRAADVVQVTSPGFSSSPGTGSSPTSSKMV